MIKIINILIVIAYLTLLLILASLESKWGARSRQKIAWMVTLFLIIFFTFREFGLDLEPYKIIYSEFNAPAALSDVPLSLFTPTVEPAFSLAIASLKIIGLDYRAFLFLSAAITFGIVCWIITKKSVRPLAILFIFSLLYLFKTADAVRHATASAVYLLGLYFIAERRKVIGSLLVTASALFHYSNTLLIIVLPFLKIKWRASYYLAASLIVIAISAPLGFMIRQASSGQDFYLFWKLSYYLEQQEIVEYQNTLHLILISFFTAFGFLFTFLLNIYLLFNRIRIADNLDKLILNSQIIGSLIALAFIIMGAPTIGFRILLPTAFGGCLLLKYFLSPKGFEWVNKHRFNLLAIILFDYNLIVILYNAGIHYPSSPFYIG